MAIEILKNTNTIEVIGTKFNLSVKTINGGFSTEKKVFTFRGRLKKNKPTVVGTISLSVAARKRITKRSKLNVNPNSVIVNSNIELALKSTTNDSNNNITSHIYDVIYTAKEATNKNNKIKVDLINEPRTIRNENRVISANAEKINNVTIGKISPSGGKQRIQIIGEPNTSFKLQINDVVVGTEGNETINITNKKLAVDGYITGIIPPNGKYSFTQLFPKVVASSSNVYTDKEYSFHIQVFKADGVTIKDPKEAFARKLLSGNWVANKKDWQDFTTLSFFQRNIVASVTFAASSTGGTKINGGTNSIKTAYRGTKGRPHKSLIKIVYTLTGRTYTTLTTGSAPNPNGVPIFSNTLATHSDWSNSVHKDNGGTIAHVSNITATGSGTSTYVLSFDVDIIRFGGSNVEMALDLDSVVAYS